MIKKLLTGLAASVGVLTLSACGGSSDTYTIFLYQENTVYSDTMPVFQRANDYAGIELEGVLQRYDSNYDSIYALDGKNADIVVNDQDTIEATALNEGIFANLSDLINAENTPNLYNYFNENPTAKAWATASDGNIYGIPFYTEGDTAKGYFIRFDWVKKLADAGKLPSGVEATEESLNNINVDEYEAILKAFKDNKNLLVSSNVTTLYPYFDRDSDFAIQELAALWGSNADFYVDDNGQVQYGLQEDTFRTAMDHIIEWRKLGIIDSKIITNTNNEDKRVTYFAQDSGGSTHDWIGTTYTFNSDVYASNLVEDFELLCILPPIQVDEQGNEKMENGQPVRVEPTRRKLIGNVTAIKNDLSDEDKIKLLKWIDFFFSEEGQELANFGVEGTDWNWEGDKRVYTDAIVNDNNTALANLYSIGAQLQAAGVQNFDYEEAWLSTEAADAMEAYAPYLNAGYNDLIYPNAKLTKDNYNTVNTNKSKLKETFDKYVAEWLKGGNPISDASWQAFQSALASDGANSVKTILQARYDETHN